MPLKPRTSASTAAQQRERRRRKSSAARSPNTSRALDDFRITTPNLVHRSTNARINRLRSGRAFWSESLHDRPVALPPEPILPLIERSRRKDCARLPIAGNSPIPSRRKCLVFPGVRAGARVLGWHVLCTSSVRAATAPRPAPVTPEHGAIGSGGGRCTRRVRERRRCREHERLRSWQSRS
jgi:hypothetical protein